MTVGNLLCKQPPTKYRLSRSCIVQTPSTVFFLFVNFCSCMNPLCSLGHHFSFEYMIPYIIYVNKWPNLYFGCHHVRQWWRRQTMESNFALNVKQIVYLLKKFKKNLHEYTLLAKRNCIRHANLICFWPHMERSEFFFLWLLWMVKPEENLLSDIILPANVSALWRTKGDKGDKNSHQTK